MTSERRTEFNTFPRFATIALGVLTINIMTACGSDSDALACPEVSHIEVIPSHESFDIVIDGDAGPETQIQAQVNGGESISPSDTKFPDATTAVLEYHDLKFAEYLVRLKTGEKECEIEVDVSN